MSYDFHEKTPARTGPEITVTVERSCYGCARLLSEYYSIEDGNDCDSGFTFCCADTPVHQLVRGEDGTLHARQVDPRKSPDWCPHLARAEWERLLADLAAAQERK